MGHVDMAYLVPIYELWHANNFGKMVTIDLSSLPGKSGASNGSIGDSKMGDIKGVFVNFYGSSGFEEFTAILKRKINGSEYLRTKPDTVFISNWELLLAMDAGKNLKYFKYGEERIAPILIGPEDCDYFFERDSAFLCGYLIYKRSDYCQGKNFYSGSDLDEEFERLNIKRSIYSSAYSAITIERRMVGIVPVGYRHK